MLLMQSKMQIPKNKIEKMEMYDFISILLKLFFFNCRFKIILDIFKKFKKFIYKCNFKLNFKKLILIILSSVKDLNHSF